MIYVNKLLFLFSQTKAGHYHSRLFTSACADETKVREKQSVVHASLSISSVSSQSTNYLSVFVSTTVITAGDVVTVT